MQIRAHAKQMLDRRSKSFKDIVATLKVYRDNITEETPASDAKDVDGQEAAPTQKEILGHLIEFLEGC